MPHASQSARSPASITPPALTAPPAPAVSQAEQQARLRWLYQRVLALPSELQPIVLLLLHLRRRAQDFAGSLPPSRASAPPPAAAAPPPAAAARVEHLTVPPASPGAAPLRITIERG